MGLRELVTRRPPTVHFAHATLTQRLMQFDRYTDICPFRFACNLKRGSCKDVHLIWTNGLKLATWSLQLLQPFPPPPLFFPMADTAR